MATLYVRNFPDDRYERVKALAAEHHRSLAAEMVVLVDKALEPEPNIAQQLEGLRLIGERRRNFKLPLGAQDTLSMLREDRER